MPAVSIRPQQDLIYLERMGAASARKHVERERREVTLSVELIRNPPRVWAVVAAVDLLATNGSA
jgi:hypothetical protein